jgi:hypothetical protein
MTKKRGDWIFTFWRVMKLLSPLAICGLAMHLLAVVCFAADKPLPHVVITLPPEVPSESVQIRYLMSGPFGGAGLFVQSEPNVQSYSVEAAPCHVEINTRRTCTHEQRIAATNIKFIVYAPGCQIRTFDTDLGESSTIELPFVCQRLPTTSLSGKIMDKELLQNISLKIAIEYEAGWDHRFFGFADGMVTTIKVATVTPDSSGAFNVQLPDFSADPIASDREALFMLLLKEAKTDNILGELKAVGEKDECLDLCIQSPYPQNLAFEVQRWK